MRFQVNVSRDSLGVKITPDRQSFLEHISLNVGGHEVLLSASVTHSEQVTYEYADTYDENGLRIPVSETDYLTLMFANVTVETEGSTLTVPEFERAQRIATTALQRALIHLRAQSEETGIDVHLGSLRLIVIQDEAGHELRPAELPQEVGNLLQDPDVESTFPPRLNPENWRTSFEHAAREEPVRLELDLLPEAKSFLDSRNFNMALLNAAISCEVSFYKLVYRTVYGSGRVSKSQAERFAEDVSFRELPSFLAYLGLITMKQADNIRLTFELRNKVVHGRRARPVSEGQAMHAIRSAQLLLDLQGSTRIVLGQQMPQLDGQQSG